MTEGAVYFRTGGIVFQNAIGALLGTKERGPRQLEPFHQVFMSWLQLGLAEPADWSSVSSLSLASTFQLVSTETQKANLGAAGGRGVDHLVLFTNSLV